MNGISVIICCYNSAKRINQTLSFLVAQEVISQFTWEIIIVDNASNDNTGKVIEEFIDNHANISFQLKYEPIPGLINARRLGIGSAKYELIVFCDDDNHLDSHYLENAFQIMSTMSLVAIAGGWCKPKLPFDPGKWIESNFTALAIEKESKAPGFVDWVFGAGMVIRKQIFQELEGRGIKIILTGRIGNKQTSGEDAELCVLVRFLGYKVCYSPDLVLHHNISANRLTKWNFIKANYKNVFMVVYFFLLNNLIDDIAVQSRDLFKLFMQSRLKYTLYYFPRIFIGRNSFFSFMMFYQNVQLLFWTFLRKELFMKTYQRIKENLYTPHGRK